MFESKYLEFRKNNGQLIPQFGKDNFFETNSIEDNLLFGLKEYETREFHEKQQLVTLDFLKKCYAENERTLQKMKFIEGFLTEKLSELEIESKRLDKEYLEINNSVSFKGYSFMEMNSFEEFYNYILEQEVTFTKNIAVYDDKLVKTTNSQQEVDFIINYLNQNSIMFVFDKTISISSLLLDFFKNVEYNVYGVLEDGEMESINLNVNSSEYPVVFNNNDSAYKSIYITSFASLSSQLKNAKFFSYEGEESLTDFYGYVLREITIPEEVEELIFVSDSSSEVFYFTEEESDELMKDLTELSASQLASKHFAEVKKIEKNEAVKSSDYASVKYIVEVIDNETITADLLMIFGREEE
jgi:hypothetical protein